MIREPSRDRKKTNKMNVLLYLVPMALLLGFTGLVGFLWTLKSGQYDDLDGAAVRILPDDDIQNEDVSL